MSLGKTVTVGVLLCSSLGPAWVSGNHLIRVIRWSAEALPAGDIEEIFCVRADHHDRPLRQEPGRAPS